MKRKFCVSLLSVAMVALWLGGCGQTGDTPSQDRQPVQSSEDVGQEDESALQEKTGELPGGEDSSSVQESPVEDGNLPVVYMTTEISPESLIAVYEALGVSPSGKIAVKLSTGEPGSNYLRTDLIGDLVMSFENPTIVECNTAYGGSRHSRSPQTDGSSH